MKLKELGIANQRDINKMNIIDSLRIFIQDLFTSHNKGLSNIRHLGFA